jgi:hypothetical protein
MVFNVTFNNISVNIVAVSFIGGGNWRTRRKLFEISDRQGRCKAYTSDKSLD